MAADRRRALGQAGESLATEALLAAGFTIVDRNWRCAAGEIDIVAREVAPDYAEDGQAAHWLVLVEVRTRRGNRFGTALQSVTRRKQAKLREVAANYVREHNWPGPWRIDVIAVQLDNQGRLMEVDHIRHAVSGE